MRTSLAGRISSAYLALTVALLVTLALFALLYSRSTYLEQVEAQLTASASMAAGEAANLLVRGRQAELQALDQRLSQSGGVRITLIGPDGTVWAESAEDPAHLENHADRPEVAEALRGGRGSSLRHSASIDLDLLYVAVPVVVDGQVVAVSRAALPVERVDRATWALVGAIGLAFGLAALAGSGLAVWLARTTTEPIKRLTRLAGTMAQGQLGTRLEVTSRDEVGELQRAFNLMADRLEDGFNAISAERNRLAAILHTVADGLVITEQDGRILELNPAAERLLGTSTAQAAGQPFIQVARDHELASLLERPGDGSRLIELGWPRRQVRAVAAAIPGPSGQRLLLLQDVTELRRLETVRRDFVANVSHELRTPLASIRAIIETLEDGALDDPPVAREFLGRLDGEAERLTQLVRELLELSRIESGQVRLEREPVDLAGLLGSIVERLGPLAQRAGLELRLATEPALPAALADAERIGQVLASLVHNAVKFTPAGGWIELRAAHRAGEALVAVVDSGVGVVPADLERIFERFYKTDRSRSGGGTGLGLAIAKHLVQAHGGRIWAESDGVNGTTILFTLPLAEPGRAPVADRQRVAWQRS